jgi:hypothetical protein
LSEEYNLQLATPLKTKTEFEDESEILPDIVELFVRESAPVVIIPPVRIILSKVRFVNN